MIADNPAVDRTPVSSRRWRIAIALLLLLALVLTFGITSADLSAWRGFDEATERWQHLPEFRAVAIDYCIRGSRAVRTRPFGIRGRSLILALRSVPMLPKKFAVNPTSRAHYQDFDSGPLCAYLHLCGEQSLKQWVDLLEDLARHPEPPEGRPRHFLDLFTTDFPMCKDAGALQSVASLIEQTQPQEHAFVVREQISALLLPQIAGIARELSLPDKPADMTPEQQQAVLDRLDAYVHSHDVELWRTKQVSDFCGGIWAQVYSGSYRAVLSGMIVVHQIGVVLLVLIVASWAWFVMRNA